MKYENAKKGELLVNRFKELWTSSCKDMHGCESEWASDNLSWPFFWLPVDNITVDVITEAVRLYETQICKCGHKYWVHTHACTGAHSTGGLVAPVCGQQCKESNYMPSCLECMPLPLLASNSPRVCLMTVCVCVHACVSKYSLYMFSLSTPVGLSVICPPIHSATLTVSHAGWACLLYVLNVSLLDSHNCSVFFTSAVKLTSTSTLPAALSLPVSDCLSLYTFYGYKTPCLALHVWACIPEPMSIDQFDTQCLKMLGVVGTFLNRVQWWAQQYQKIAEVN